MGWDGMGWDGMGGEGRRRGGSVCLGGQDVGDADAR